MDSIRRWLNKTFIYVIDDCYYFVPLSEIFYLTASKTKQGVIILHALNKDAEFVGNLDTIEDIYPMFFRSDKRYLVNLNKMYCFDSKNRILTFVDDSIAYFSIKMAKELVKNYLSK